MAAEAGCAVLHSCQLTGSMVIYQLSDAYDSPLVDAPVRGRFVGTLGPVATLLHTLLVHDVSLATQAGQAGRKGLNSISALLQIQKRVEDSIRALGRRLEVSDSSQKKIPQHHRQPQTHTRCC